MTLFGRFRRESLEVPAGAIYGAVVRQAREPGFYVHFGVPDTPDGRFDMIALHAFLVLRRLKRDHDRTADLSQALFDTMFADIDQNLREMGAGDLGVGKKVKGLAKAFYGRINVYEAGLESRDSALAEALRRNLYRKTDPSAGQVDAIARYMRREAERLDALAIDGFIAGDVAFGPPPDPET